jgi:hypothetical protein
MHYDVPPPKKVGINPTLKGLNLDIMFICSKLHLLHCVCSWSCHSTFDTGFTFWRFIVGRLEGMVNYGKTMCGIIVHHLTSHMWMASGSIIGHSSNRFRLMLWRITRCCNHVKVCEHCCRRWHMGYLHHHVWRFQ